MPAVRSAPHHTIELGKHATSNATAHHQSFTAARVDVSIGNYTNTPDVIQLEIWAPKQVKAPYISFQLTIEELRALNETITAALAEAGPLCAECHQPQAYYHHMDWPDKDDPNGTPAPSFIHQFDSGQMLAQTA